MKFNSGKEARVEVVTVCALVKRFTLCNCPGRPLADPALLDINRLTLLAPLCIAVVFAP